MKGAFLILAFTVITGLLLYIHDRCRRRNGTPSATPDNGNEATPVEKTAGGDGSGGGDVCCGMHSVCEKTTLMPLSPDIVYYDDEELDRFRGREASSYTPAETEEFRDVLMTLLAEDVAGWSRSIQLRGIQLPPEIRDELLMIVSDIRQRITFRIYF